MTLLRLSVAPILIILFYTYIRDKYEKEPYRLLFTGVLLGAIMTAPILLLELKFENLLSMDGWIGRIFSSFFISAGTEEALKGISVFFLIWYNKNYNEKFDGIVYAVFVSLGFALVENILYVFNETIGGMATGIYRAIFAVPAHGLYGVFMGYYLAISKFDNGNKFKNFLLAFLYAILLHGVYDLILSFGAHFMILGLYMFFLFTFSLKMMKKHLETSPFKYKNVEQVLKK